MTKQRRLKPGYAAVNKNLCNFPLARDARVRARWRRSKKTRRWLCNLPGDERIQFWLPAEVDEPRGPTGFDMAVLFLLLREARVKGTNKVRFASLAGMLQALGVGIDTHNRRRLQDALELWSLLTVRYREWYQAERLRRGPITQEQAEAAASRDTHIDKSLPPPIGSIEINARRVRIIVAKAWREIAAYYYAQVPLPLPVNTATQNLILYLLAPHMWGRFPKEYVAVRLKVKSLCRKIGSRRGDVWRRAVIEAKAWFKSHGIELMDSECEGAWVRQDGIDHYERERYISFMFSPEPEIERRRLRKRAPVVPEAEAYDDDEERDQHIFDEDGNLYDKDGNRIADA